MKLDIVHTRRNFETQFYWDIVYEWEDVFCEKNNAKLYNEIDSKHIYKLEKIKYLRHFNFLYPNKYALRFEMDAGLGRQIVNAKHIIPWIIDFYLTEKHIADFNLHYLAHPIVLVSCADAYLFLLDNHNLCPDVNIAYLPLSISDKYKINSKTKFDKSIDVILFGNQDEMLKSFFDKYISQHRNVTYAMRKNENGHFAYYKNDGSFVGYADTREQYLSLMRSARISLYTTAIQYNIDSEGWQSFRHVTPRFLEMIACGCHVLMRYVNNEDTRFYQLNDFCKSLDRYDDFENAMDNALNTNVDMIKYSDYLSKHYTSVRVEQLRKIISDL